MERLHANLHTVGPYKVAHARANASVLTEQDFVVSELVRVNVVVRKSVSQMQSRNTTAVVLQNDVRSLKRKRTGRIGCTGTSKKVRIHLPSSVTLSSFTRDTAQVVDHDLLDRLEHLETESFDFGMLRFLVHAFVAACRLGAE